MGAGDWIMATAQARRLNVAQRRPVLIVDRAGRPQWHEVFENNPRILRLPKTGCVRLINAAGARPYIQFKTAKCWHWKVWDIEPGELYLSDDEKAFAQQHAGAVLIEPNTKVAGSNKAWIWDRWQELVARGGEFVQVGPAGTRVLDGVKFVETPNFRAACAVLDASRAFVGCEGGLHHAAAALGRPAVVLFSEFISPEFTGYKSHRNLRHAGAACGMRAPCGSCARSMQAISVDEVSRNLEQIL